MNCWNS